MGAAGFPTPNEGENIGGYVVGERLGEGATGAVYRAVRDEDGLEVALKVLKRVLTLDETYIARFRREARVATEVRHRNLVPVLEFGDDRGFAYIATEYRDSGSLADLIATEGMLPVAQCTRLAAEIAAGLNALHQREIVHRDVKPANVMLDRAQAAALTDFGLARGHAYTVLTRPGQVLGTLDYLAPELIEGKEATPAGDIYALGCMVYECVTGRAPFAERGIFEVAVAHIEEEPPDPRERRDSLGPDYAWALLRALQKDPADRPPTAIAYARMLSVATPSP
jgi:serine/threonine protein kinase